MATCFKDVSAVFIKSCYNQHTHPICIITGIILPDLFSLGNQDVPYGLALFSRWFSFPQVGICDRSLKGTILYTISRCWFQIFCMFTLFSGKICNLSIFFIIFQMGWFNHQPVVTWDSKMQVGVVWKMIFLFNWVRFEVLAVRIQGCTTFVLYHTACWWFRNPANHLGFGEPCKYWDKHG